MRFKQAVIVRSRDRGIRRVIHVCRQPICLWLIAWFHHHVWERLTWRLLVAADRRWPGDREDGWRARAVRQDLRCFRLHNRRRTLVREVDLDSP